MHRVVTEYTAVDSNNASNIKVFIRARPSEDNSDPADIIQLDPDDERKLVIKDPDTSSNRRYSEVSFQFDKIFWTGASQQSIFEEACIQQVEHVLNGYNSCCFAYGQTGSGKTYTMFGADADIRGVIPRSVEYLFQTLTKRTNTTEVALVCSFLEIYNDQIRDLGKAYLVDPSGSQNHAQFEKTSDIFESLAGKRGNPYFAPVFHRPKTAGGAAASNEVDARPGLRELQDEYNTMNYDIREDNEGNVFVKDLSLVPVQTMDQVMHMINAGLRVRATHETKMNAVSSRSHTVFTITVLQRDKITGQAMSGMLNLVDLAGSERIKKSESQGVRLKEALHINTSLTALGKVIMALDSNADNTNAHIPYRDSKLTRVLQNSLGGNSYACLIAAIHPMTRYYDECLSTLQFANRCRNVRNNPRVNYIEDGEDKDRKLKKLNDELMTLRNKLAQVGSMGSLKPNEVGSGGGGSISAAKIVNMLKMLGVNASLTSDGAILFNGKKITLDSLGIGEGDNDSVAGGGAMKGKDGSAMNSVSTSGTIDKLQKTIKELKESNENNSLRAKERKNQIEEQAKEIAKLSTELVKCKTTIKHKEFEYNQLLEEKERSLAEQRLLLESKQKDEIQNLLQSNKDMLRIQQAENDRVPMAVKEYTRLINTMDKQKQSFEAPLRKEFDSHLSSIEKHRMEELDMVKRQYDQFLKEKDKALHGFVEAFNAYRNKKSEQLRMAEREIVRLYDYTEKIEEILDNVEKGKYKVRQLQGQRGGKSTTGVMLAMMSRNGTAPPGTSHSHTEQEGTGDNAFGAVVLPKGIKPINPLKLNTGKSTAGLELTKKIVSKHKERVAKLDQLKEEAFQKSLQYAAEIGATAQSGIDEVLQNQVRDLLVSKEPVSPKKESSTPKHALRNQSTFDNNTAALFNHGSRPVTSGPTSNVPSRGMHATAPGSMQNLLNPGNHSHSSDFFNAKTVRATTAESNHNQALSNEIIAELEQLRLQANIESITNEKLLNDIASEDTFKYIKKLEDEINLLRKGLQDSNAQLQSVKVANASLSRQLQKSNEKL